MAVVAVTAVTLQEKGEERPMVKGKIAKDPEETAGALAGTAMMEVTATMSRAGAEEPRHHHDATNLSMGQCLTHIGSVKGKRSKPPRYRERRLIFSYGLIQSQMR